jgi:hypothetical protein
MSNPPKNDLELEADEIVETLEPRLLQYQKMRATLEEGLSASGKKLRRNTPCPCGSGRKFKKCCLNDMKSKINAKTPIIRKPKKRKIYEN